MKEVSQYVFEIIKHRFHNLKNHTILRSLKYDTISIVFNTALIVNLNSSVYRLCELCMQFDKFTRFLLKSMLFTDTEVDVASNWIYLFSVSGWLYLAGARESRRIWCSSWRSGPVCFWRSSVSERWWWKGEYLAVVIFTLLNRTSTLLIYYISCPVL